MVDIQDEFPFQSSTDEIKRLLPQIRKARGQKNYDVEMLLGQFELQNCATARTGKVALAVATWQRRSKAASVKASVRPAQGRQASQAYFPTSLTNLQSPQERVFISPRTFSTTVRV